MPGPSALLLHFGHYFELVAGASAAFMLSDKFTESLITKIATPFSTMDANLEMLKKEIHETENLFNKNSAGLLVNFSVNQNSSQRIRSKLSELYQKIHSDRTELVTIVDKKEGFLESY